MHTSRCAADKKVTVGDQGAPSSDLECFSVGFWKRQIFDEFSIGKKVVPKSPQSAKLAAKGGTGATFEAARRNARGRREGILGGAVISNQLSAISYHLVDL